MVLVNKCVGCHILGICKLQLHGVYIVFTKKLRLQFLYIFMEHWERVKRHENIVEVIMDWLGARK